MNRITCLLLLLTAGLSSAAPLTDDQIIEAVRTREAKLEEVTLKPQFLQGLTKFLCNEPKPEQIAEEKANPHLEKYARFFVDKAGRPAAEGHEPVHPEGTVLLKEKLPAVVGKDDKVAPGKIPELFTGMLKREKGYNKECGDWEFFTVSGDTKKVTARGKLTSCMDCHQRYPDFDYTSRKLVPERLLKTGAEGAVTLSAHDASVSGKGLRYDAPGNSLTNWAAGSDCASWLVEIPKGRYVVKVVHSPAPQVTVPEVQLQFTRRHESEPFSRITVKVDDTVDIKAAGAALLDVDKGGILTLKMKLAGDTGAPGFAVQRITIQPAVDSTARRGVGR